MSIQGRRVALAEGRQLEELAAMLEKEGAVPLRYPLVSILDAPDPAPVAEWLRELVAGRFNYVVFLTGEGVRRLLEVAVREGLRDQTVAALGRTTTVTRGPKPGKALREIGLTADLIADAPTTEGVIATLKRETLARRHVGVQLYSESNPPLVGFLESAGATVSVVRPYVYAPAADADRVAELVERMADGGADVLVITSTPQVARLFEVAAERGVEARLREGLQRVCVAAVGPVAADSLRERGVRVDVCPELGFVMRNLVQQIKRHLGPTGSGPNPSGQP
jgi:uroporphyrinogen-III synthase